MGTKIDHDKLYKIQTYSFHDAVITVTEACYSRTEVDPPTKPNKWGHTPSPTVHADGSEHYYKYNHWEEAVAVVPLHFNYEDNLTEADKIKVVLETERLVLVGLCAVIVSIKINVGLSDTNLGSNQ